MYVGQVNLAMIAEFVRAIGGECVMTDSHDAVLKVLLGVMHKRDESKGDDLQSRYSRLFHAFASNTVSPANLNLQQM